MFRGGIAQWNECSRFKDCLCPYQDVFPDKATQRKILSLAIKCPSEGCEWTGELREKEVRLLQLISQLKINTKSLTYELLVDLDQCADVIIFYHILALRDPYLNVIFIQLNLF